MQVLNWKEIGALKRNLRTESESCHINEACRTCSKHYLHHSILLDAFEAKQLILKAIEQCFKKFAKISFFLAHFET